MSFDDEGLQMRPWLSILIGVICLSQPGLSQPGTLPRRARIVPPMSASDAKAKWVMVVITDQDPSVHGSAEAEAVDAEAFAGDDLWCLPLLRPSMEQLIETRPDLRERIVIAKLAAGIPSSWQATQTARLPSRALVVLCDAKQRVLSFAAGVPDETELIRLVEQAEEVTTLLSLYKDNQDKLNEELVAHAIERVGRQYREFIEDQAIDDVISQPIGSEAAFRQAFGRYVAQLQPVYHIDVTQRFSIEPNPDTPRMRVLEQHCETRQDWCESVLPWLQGKTLENVIDLAVDATWRQPSVIDLSETTHQDLLRWFESRRAVSTVVLSLRPDLISEQVAWPPPNVNPKMRGRSWGDLESAMAKHAYRTVSLEELVVLFQESQLDPIVLNQGGRVRYVVFETDKKVPSVIRETDLPSRFIRRLKAD